MTRHEPRSKHWCFTINNPTEEDDVNPDDFEYIIIAQEVGKDGTPHLQGYVVFKIRKYLTGAKKMFLRAHLEIMRGTSEQAIHYCKKPVPDCTCKHCIKAKDQVPDWIEAGTVPKTNSERMTSRWAESRKLAEEGNFDDIAPDMWIRYIHSFLRIRQLKAKTPDKLGKRSNLWIVAPSGYGKSTYAWENYPDAYDKMPNKWWLAYKDEETIILDDWSPKECEYMSYYLKRWADVFPFMAETKGGGKFIRPTKFVVTSQYTIKECFDDPKVVEAIQNRFKVLELQDWRERTHYSKIFNKQL